MNTKLNKQLNDIATLDFSSTYKLSMLVSILNIVKEGNYDNQDIIRIPIVEITKKMLGYYWDQAIYFKLNQNSDTAKSNKFEGIINKYFKKEYEAELTFAEVTKQVDIITINKAVKSLSSKLYDMNFTRLKNNWNYYTLEGFAKAESFVVIDKEQYLFMQDNYESFKYISLFKWAKILETFNKDSSIILKVENSIYGFTRDGNKLVKYAKELRNDYNEEQCFYTGETLRGDDISLDHVIPWSYTLSDDKWNLVLCKRAVNSSKGNKPPKEEHIKKLIEINKLRFERNDTVFEKISDFKEVEDKIWSLYKNYIALHGNKGEFEPRK